MPVREISPGRFRWGAHGRVYSSRAAAERQGRAAYAAGFRDDARRRKAAILLTASRKAELGYVLAVRAVMRAIHEAVLHVVRREIGPRTPDLRQDAGFGDAKRRLAMMWDHVRSWVRLHVTHAFDKMSEDVAINHSRGARLLGINVRASVPRMTRFLEQAREENVQLIRGASSDFLQQVRDTLDEFEGQEPGAKGGLIEALQDRVGVSESRATLIGIDQTLKTNAAISRIRMQSAGVSRYRWSGSLDERERASHLALEGQIFDFDNPPVTNDDGDTNNPGEDYRCRCVALPIVDELEEETEEAPDEAAE
jgi:SPP1 gp7 family putative phage head morphogenesis protein